MKSPVYCATVQFIFHHTTTSLSIFFFFIFWFEYCELFVVVVVDVVSGSHSLERIRFGLVWFGFH